MQPCSKKVLYVDDEYTSREILKVSLNTNGIDCDLAEDGIKALDMCEKNIYDMVILDQYLPDLNGDKIARILKSKKPDLPLIAITSDDKIVNTLKGSGFADVLLKPVFKTNFVNRIKKYL